MVGCFLQGPQLSHARMSKNDRREFLRMVGCFLQVTQLPHALTFLSRTAEIKKTQIPLYSPRGNPENIQRKSRKLKSRCILAAKIPKTYSGIQEIPDPAVSPLQKSRKHTAEIKKTQIPLYPRCKNPENIQRDSRKLKSRCVLTAETTKPYSGIQENSNLAVFPRLFCGILIATTLPEGRFPA